MDRVTTLVIVIVVLSITLLIWSFFAKRHPIRRTFAVLTGIPLLILGLNNLRNVPLLDYGFDLVLPPHAVRADQSAVCSKVGTQAMPLVDDKGEETLEQARPYLHCAVQTVVNEPAPYMSGSRTEEQCWPETQEEAKKADICYRMAFLEFDRNGTLLAPSQLSAVFGAIDRWRQSNPNREIYLVSFVHGWRHGAAINDSDVRRLRVIASYATAHLHERCRIAGQHCSAMVFAIYVAWPASTNLIEGSNQFHQVMAGPSFPRRKRVSDDVGAGIMTQLDKVYTAVHSTPQAAGEMLLIGHSLGGNALLTAAAPRLHASIRHAGDTFDRDGAAALTSDRLGLPADLVVIINPASEARKLDNIRLDAAEVFETAPLPGQPAIRGVRDWPDQMPPRLMIISSNCENPFAKDKSEDPDKGYCDDVVGGWFEVSQKYAEGLSQSLDTIGIGHLSYPALKNRGDPIAAQRDTSLSVEINYQQKVPFPATSYANARHPYSRCFEEPAWLICARGRGMAVGKACSRANHNAFDPWSTGDGSNGADVDKTLDVFADVHAPGQSNVQFNYPSGRSKTQTTVQRADPIWALDANHSAVSTHGAISSAPLLCTFSKLLLDAPATPTDSSDPRLTYRDDNMRYFAERKALDNR